MKRAKAAVYRIRFVVIPLPYLAVAIMLIPACTAGQVKHIPPTREGAPYSRAVWVGDMLYLSGDGAPHV